MSRRGHTLIEVTVASVSLSLIIGIAYAAYIGTTEAQTATSERTVKRLNTQAILDSLVESVKEADSAWMWKTAVAGEFTGAETQGFPALVLWSPRDLSTGRVAPDSGMSVQPFEAIAFVPLKNGEGAVDLYQFDFGSASIPSGSASDYPSLQLTADSRQLSLQYVDSEGNPGTPVSIARVRGRVVARGIKSFTVVDPAEEAYGFEIYENDEEGNPRPVTYLPPAWQIGLTLPVSEGTRDITIQTLVMPRN